VSPVTHDIMTEPQQTTRPGRWPDPDDVVTRAMLGLLQVELRRAGSTARPVGVEIVEVTGTHAGRFGVGNLRRLLSRTPKADWPDVVEAHVRELLDPASDLARRGWAEIRPLLRPWPLPLPDARPAPASESGLEYVVSEGSDHTLGADLTETLLIDGDLNRTAITAATLDRWAVSATDAFRVARENVRTAGRLDRAKLMRDGMTITILYGRTPYAAAHTQWLGDYLDLDAHGALVVMPHRYLIGVYPMRGRVDATVIGGMLRFARHQHETGPAALSDQLYWCRDGVLTRQPAEHTAESIRFHPTPEFQAVIDDLAATADLDTPDTRDGR
jgi:hypothetical protein